MALSQQQVAELKQRMIEEKQKLADSLATLMNTTPANNPDRLLDNADVGEEAVEDRELDRYDVLITQNKRMIERLEEALQRIEDGTYGVTTDGEDIPYERLLIDPTATTLVRPS